MKWSLNDRQMMSYNIFPNEFDVTIFLTCDLYFKYIIIYLPVIVSILPFYPLKLYIYIYIYIYIFFLPWW